MILRYWREVAILILAAACYLLYTKKPLKCPTVVADTKVVKVETVDTVQKVVVITVKPDGTKTEKTVTTEKQTQTKEKEKVHEIAVPVAVEKPLTRYDIHLTRPVSDDPYDYQVGVGARLGDLPVFGTADYRWKTREILLGVRVEW